jgi:cell division protein FtsN
MVTAPSWIWTDCEHCGSEFGQPDDPGRKRRFCSGACRTAAYRARKRRQRQEQQRQEQQRQEQQRQEQQRQEQQRQEQQRQEQQRQEQRRRTSDDAGSRQRERARQRASQPPPHAGTSRSGTWCGPCGGVHGPHTFHHDDATHTRAWRRYEGLKAKAASTSYPHEADACQAKAESLRDKYGL